MKPVIKFLTYYGIKDKDYSPCDCCGMTVNKIAPKKGTTPFLRNKGIRLYPGKQWEEGVDEKHTIKHLETKNGTITLALVTRK
jgi:hypothetical protein